MDIERKPMDRAVINIDKILDEARVLAVQTFISLKISPIVRLSRFAQKAERISKMNEMTIMKIVEQMTSGRNLENIKNKIDTDFSYVTRRGYRHRVNVFHQRKYSNSNTFAAK